MNIFDSAFKVTLETDDHMMGQDITINSKECRGVVNVIEASSKRFPGGLTQDRQTTIHIDHDTHADTQPRSGMTVVADEQRFKIQSVNRLGGAGFELVCTSEDRASGSPFVQ